MTRWIGWCEKVLLYGAGGAVVVMMLLTTFDATGRYFLNRPITGAYELTEKLFMVLTLLGVCHAYRNGSYVRLTFVTDHLPKRLRVAVNYLVQATCTAATLALAVSTFLQAVRVYRDHTVMDVRGWSVPLWPSYGVIPVAMLFLFLAMAMDWLKVGKDRSALFGGRDSEL
jgi:TRAP-type C4-dicarboxylate transport system permease small subunit